MPCVIVKNQNGFTYTISGTFTKNKDRTQKFKETGDSRFIYQSKLDKACFNMTWLMENLKIKLEEQLLIKYCVIKHLVLLKIQNMMDIKRVLLQWFINFLTKICFTCK